MTSATDGRTDRQLRDLTTRAINFKFAYYFVVLLNTVPIALVDGPSPQEGRLEVQYNGVWGTVCNDGFTDASARVVCYSLGFGYVNRVT